MIKKKGVCDHIFVDVEDSEYYGIVDSCFDPRKTKVICCMCGKITQEWRH